MLIELDYNPQDYQFKFHADSSRYRIICGGRRSGKTKCVIQEAIRHSLETPSALTFLVAPTFQLSREVLWEEFMNYHEQLEPAIFRMHHSQMRVQLTNGSLMYFKGSDNPDSLRGRGLTMYIGDEAAFHKPDVWKLIIRPSLSDKKGRAVLTSTPNGRNWFYDLTTNPNWSYYHWITANNKLISEEEIETAKSEMSETDFNQEYLAEFITRSGRVYNDFNESNIIQYIETIDLNEYDVYIGMDFGFATITCACFMAVSRHIQKVIMFDEIYVSHLQMTEIINKINDTLKLHSLNRNDVKSIYTDPAGNSEELTSGLSPVDELRRAGFTVINKGSKINPGCALVRAFVKNTLNERKFMITNICKQAARSMDGYVYDSNKLSGLVKEEPLKDGLNDHMCDAIRYFFVNKFDYAKYVASEPKTNNYYNKQTPIKNKAWKYCAKCHNIFLSDTPKNQPPFICKNCRSENVN